MNACNKKPPVIWIAGGAPDTGNLGCSALGIAAVKNVRRISPNARIILQNWTVVDKVAVQLEEGAVNVEVMMIHRSNSLKARHGSRLVELLMRSARRSPALLGRAVRLLNRTAGQLLDVDAILDVTGGDSFSDLYADLPGSEVLLPKLLAMRHRIPLVLLPQTYGPFAGDKSREIVRRIVEYSTLAASRDLDGMMQLQHLLEVNLDGKLVECPDIAFTMDPAAVSEEEEPALIRRDSECVVGLNLSGLLYSGTQNFGLANGYRSTMRALAEAVLSRDDTRIVLIPHVFLKEYDENGPPVSGECPVNCDRSANFLLYQELKDRYPGRIDYIRCKYDAPQMKCLIGRCDFFIGSRMHSCVAALSQNVPAAVLAYSKKADGVMGLAGVPETVVDLREHDEGESVRRIASMLDERDGLRRKLEKTMPAVKQQVYSFFRDVLAPKLDSLSETTALLRRC